MTKEELEQEQKNYEFWLKSCQDLGFTLASWDGIEQATVFYKGYEEVTLPHWVMEKFAIVREAAYKKGLRVAYDIVRKSDTLGVVEAEMSKLVGENEK